MGALTRCDVLFLVWNAAVGLVVGALTVRWAELASAPVPPVLWLVVGMAAFEIGGAVLLGGGGPLVTYAMRIIALAISFATYALVSAVFGTA